MLHQGSVNLTASELHGNVAAAAVGASGATSPATIYYKLGSVPTSAGGAAYVWHGALKLKECVIADNVAWGSNGRGGAVYVDDSTLQLVSSTLRNNYASAAGGAILLGPSGSQALQSVNSSFSGNAAQKFGGAVAAGLLLPNDAVTANAQARLGVPVSSWTLAVAKTRFLNNTAGMQGGAVACSLCSTVSITNSNFTHNAAVQTGGGVSCVGCKKYTTNACSFRGNLAASGGGACILAAGNGSASSHSSFVGNTAGQGALSEAVQRLEAASRMAASTVQSQVKSLLTAGLQPAPPGLSAVMPSTQQTLPACGVVGSGGGLCLGVWDTGFNFLGSSSFINNTALFGAGLFVEACPEGAMQCPVSLNPRSAVFQNNSLTNGGAAMGQGNTLRNLLQLTGPVALDMPGLGDGNVTGRLGSGSDLYATNATVLVTAGTAAAAAAADKPAAAGGRHLLQQKSLASSSTNSSATPHASHAEPASLLVAQQLAAYAADASIAGSTAPAAGRVATGPSHLGPVTANNRSAQQAVASSISKQQLLQGPVSENGKLARVTLTVLDQLGNPVSTAVAEQLSVEADLGCEGCGVGGISKVQPMYGVAVFDSIQLLAPPGSNQSVTFTLLNATGAKIGGQQSVKVRLPTCQWGQATNIVGCYNCSYPLFTFSSPSKAKLCSECPANSVNCSGTMLLPDNGYWHSGPLSTRMIKCPRRKACFR